MKSRTKYYLFAIFTVFLLFTFSGCHLLFPEDDEPEPEYLISYEMVRSVGLDFIKSLLNNQTDQYPGISVINDQVKNGIIVYKITYKTTFQGDPVVASGLVSVPTGEGQFPVMSYQNGTNTLHRNAPSANPNYELYLLLEAVAATGMIVSIPDYLGFGASEHMFHPYLHKESTVQSVIDMLRALKELAEMRNISTNGDLYLTGYSQGGWATMQLHKAIESNYSDEFNLQASVPCAGPHDLTYINDHIRNSETYPMPYFAAYLFNSFINLGAINTPVEDVFSTDYASLVSTLFDGSSSGQEINDLLTPFPGELFTENYRQNYASDPIFTSLKSALGENSIKGWKTSVPTRVVHGTNDQLVPFQVSENIVQEFHEAGSGEVTLIPLAGLDHGEGIIPAGLLAVQWFLELSE
ncbi:MAG: lipase family protein [Mariniphaga sp.]|nr:lipase family protein [Mariniphaga sp.]